MCLHVASGSFSVGQVTSQCGKLKGNFFTAQQRFQHSAYFFRKSDLDLIRIGQKSVSSADPQYIAHLEQKERPALDDDGPEVGVERPLSWCWYCPWATDLDFEHFPNTCSPDMTQTELSSCCWHNFANETRYIVKCFSFTLQQFVFSSNAFHEWHKSHST